MGPKSRPVELTCLECDEKAGNEISAKNSINDLYPQCERFDYCFLRTSAPVCKLTCSRANAMTRTDGGVFRLFCESFSEWAPDEVEYDPAGGGCVVSNKAAITVLFQEAF